REEILWLQSLILEDAKNELITSVDVFRGNENEGSKLRGLIEKEKRNNLKTRRVIADALYDSIDNRKFCLKENIEAYIPSRREAKILERFIYSSHSDTLICFQGKRSINKTYQEKGFLYLFSQKDCKRCSKKRRLSYYL
ncbi:MAG TPA: hypothetical protein EYP89_04110, partial [Candidatus Omnitrophica bacterium]|nr:hypothetical protein [Candidatus Omnitrophota bacterium]